MPKMRGRRQVPSTSWNWWLVKTKIVVNTDTKEAKKEAETIINKALTQITQIPILKSITELVQTE